MQTSGFLHQKNNRLDDSNLWEEPIIKKAVNEEESEINESFLVDPEGLPLQANPELVEVENSPDIPTELELTWERENELSQEEQVELFTCSRCGNMVEDLFQMDFCRDCLTQDFQKLITIINLVRN